MSWSVSSSWPERRPGTVPLGCLIVACAAAATAVAAPRDPAPVHPAESTTLLLALDGVPLRVIRRARAAGAFHGWSHPIPLVSTFPSTTHVAFSSLLRPFGVSPAGGYEHRYFSTERNRMVGGNPFRYRRHSNPWKDMLQIERRSFGAKLLVYTFPGNVARRELEHVAREVLRIRDDVILAHIGSTDALEHLRGDAATLDFVLDLERMLVDLRRDYRTAHGRRLRVVLYSDHGNGDGKVRPVRGIRRRLRRAGFRVTDRLQTADDVVAPTFGIVSYGALFTRPDRAERAARAVTGVRGVDLAAWRSADNEVTVLTRDARAVVLWLDDGGVRRLAYRALEGDPLDVEEAALRLQRSGELDERGFAPRVAWFRATLAGPYPDAPGRLVEGLSGDRVRSRATVLLSLAPGWAWGLRAAHMMSHFQGGKLEGTHGGLDRESSLGFLISDDPGMPFAHGHWADRALASFVTEAPDRIAAALGYEP